MNQHPAFPAELTDHFEPALNQLQARVPEIFTACIATRDGFEIARLTGKKDQRKLAAMASSMHALGDAIAAETTLGECINVIIEGKFGKAVMLSIPEESNNKVLIAAANLDVNLALLLLSSRSCCEQLAKNIKKFE